MKQHSEPSERIIKLFAHRRPSQIRRSKFESKRVERWQNIWRTRVIQIKIAFQGLHADSYPASPSSSGTWRELENRTA